MASRSHPDQLVISLEPEAASIYCRRLRMTQLVPDVPPSMPPLTLERNKKLMGAPELVEDYVGDHISTGISSVLTAHLNVLPNGFDYSLQRFALCEAMKCICNC